MGGLMLDPERALWVPGRKLISIPNPVCDPQTVAFFRHYLNRIVTEQMRDYALFNCGIGTGILSHLAHPHADIPRR